MRRPHRARGLRPGGRADSSRTSCGGPIGDCRNDGIPGRIQAFKNNTDSAGNSYGCHENYLVSRGTPFPRLVEALIPFLVSRQIFAGAGKIHRGRRGVRVPPEPARRPYRRRGVGNHGVRPAHHQHARRAARGRRAVSPPPRDRRRLQHVRGGDLPQGRHHRPRARHDRGRILRPGRRARVRRRRPARHLEGSFASQAGAAQGRSRLHGPRDPARLPGGVPGPRAPGRGRRDLAGSAGAVERRPGAARAGPAGGASRGGLGHQEAP